MDMRHRRFRCDAMTKIEDMAARRHGFKDFINGAVHRGAAGDQTEGVKIP